MEVDEYIFQENYQDLNEYHLVGPPIPLLDLPNECLREIFDRMDIMSLCQLATVCIRFRSIAETAFYKRFKYLEYRDVQYNRSLFRRVLCRFGHLIYSIYDGCCFIRCKEEIDAYAIAVYCTHIKELTIYGGTIDCGMSKQLFARLRALKLVLCEFIGDANLLFSKCRKLEELVIRHASDCVFLERKFPKLRGLVFDTSHLGTETLLKLLKLNPRVSRLLTSIQLNDQIIFGLLKHTKYMEKIRFFSDIMTTTTITPKYTKEVFIQLSSLRLLQILILEKNSEIYNNSLSLLMKAISERRTPIKFIYLRKFSISPEVIRSFTYVKSITVLNIHEVQQCTDDDLSNLVKGLPSLVTLVLLFGNTLNNPVSMNGLIDIVIFGKHLSLVQLSPIRHFNIDENVYNFLMESCQANIIYRKVKTLFIRIVGCKCNSSYHVPYATRINYAREKKFSLTFTEKKCLNCIL